MCDYIQLIYFLNYYWYRYIWIIVVSSIYVNASLRTMHISLNAWKDKFS